MVSRGSKFSARGARVAAGALMGLATAAGLVLILGGRPPAEPLRATVFPSPIPLPEFALSDADGRPFTRRSFEDRWSLVFFGFTNCPDICPATLQQLALARRRMAQALPADRLPEILFISVDPERDTAEAIAAYTGAFGDGVRAARGDLAELDKLTRSLGVYHARTPSEEGGYTVEHSAAVIVIDDQAEYRAVFGPPHDVEAIAHDTALIMAAR